MTISSRNQRQISHRPLPRQWLFTDERLGGAQPDDPLWIAIERLPLRSGIIFRHYSWPLDQRRMLLGQILAIARRRALRVVVSELPGAPVPRGGVHRPTGSSARRSNGLLTAAAHDAWQLRQAFRKGADLVFLSPVFETASHPDGAVLGARRFGRMARKAAGPVVALGGVDRRRARMLRRLGAYGYAGIDCWVEG